VSAGLLVAGLLWLAGSALAGPAAVSVDGGTPSPLLDHEGAGRLAAKALARIKSGAWDEAALLLRRAHEKDPRNAAIANDWGYTLAHLGQRDEAEQLYRLALKLDPNRFYAYVNLAELWATDPMRWQRRDEMLGFLENALPLLAGDAKAAAHVELRLAELLKGLGLSAQARGRLEQLTAATTTTPLQVRQRASQLLDEMGRQRSERSLEDWPEPAVPPEDRTRLAQAQAAADARAALPIVDALVSRWPAWTQARWERARQLERLGQYDEATRDLTIVVQLMPSHALAWRRLGILLTLHGGGFEAERADLALRHALALEPSWTDLRELREQVAKKLARGGKKTESQRAAAPTAKARQLFAEAQSWIGIEAADIAPPLLRQALAESPAFVEAAAALYTIEHKVPEATVKALWNDGEGLWRLALAIGAPRSREAAALARPWIDRAVELDVEEARFARASLRAATGDKAGALADLRDYVAAAAAPPHLDEALALRLTLAEPAMAASPAQLVHLRLAADQPAEALAALGGACRPGIPFENLLAIGRVHEYSGHPKDALECYQRAVDSAGADPEPSRRAFVRFAAAATALPAVELTSYEPGLAAAAKAGVGLAAFSLARMAEARKQWPAADAFVRQFLESANPDEPAVVEARALQSRMGKVIEREVEESKLRTQRLGVGGALLGLAVLGLLLLRRQSRPALGRALRRQPLLFPALAKAVGQIRHDVLKHRASALELLSDPMTSREDVARAMLEPTPVSDEVAGIYQHLVQEARGLGLKLCPLAREPVFGPLAADLARAETLLAEPHANPLPALWQIDERLRSEHADRLQALLAAGPRAVVDAALLARFCDAVAGEPEGTRPMTPQLVVPEAVTFPLPEAALGAIASNLLRNALDAARRAPQPAVAVRVEHGRDITGRRTVSLFVADSSPETLDGETIEKRPADRGLGIVRETARTWGGEIRLREEALPLRKAIGVTFPAPPEVKP
jgi:tetratricopeptide (TPR) repeat protein